MAHLNRQMQVNLHLPVQIFFRLASCLQSSPIKNFLYDLAEALSGHSSFVGQFADTSSTSRKFQSQLCRDHIAFGRGNEVAANCLLVNCRPVPG